MKSESVEGDVVLDEARICGRLGLKVGENCSLHSRIGHYNFRVCF